MPALCLLRIDSKNELGRIVHRGDDAFGIHAHHPRRDIFQHHLHVAPAFFEFHIGGLERVIGAVQFSSALPQIFDHIVKRSHEHPDFVLPVRVQMHVQVALGNPLSGREKLLDRPGKVFGKVEAKPHRREYRQHGNDREGDKMTLLEGLVKHLELKVTVVARGNRFQPEGKSLAEAPLPLSVRSRLPSGTSREYGRLWRCGRRAG